MVKLGYALSSEEHEPLDLVRYGKLAEEAGFDFVMISDHYHPWTSRQGHSAFVWSVIGALAASTSRIVVGTGVTCPTMRIHPAIIAQASATAAAMLPGRFILGVGSGEALNEHILGETWPPVGIRIDMLDEAIAVIRKLWGGEEVTHVGQYYRVHEARLYTLPAEPPPLLVAAVGPVAARLAAQNDGLISTAPKGEIPSAFAEAGGQGKPRYAQTTFCWDPNEQEARRIAFEHWSTAAVPGPLHQELATPALFDALTSSVTEDEVAQKLPTGSGPEFILQSVEEYVRAGYDHVYLHQIGPKQEEFLRFCSEHILPRASQLAA